MLGLLPLLLLAALAHTGAPANIELEESSGCPMFGQWYRRGDHCYHYSGSDETANWFQSQLFCQDFYDGNLASVFDAEVNEMLNALTFCKEHAWLGRVNVDPSRRNSVDAYRWWDGESNGNYSRHSFSTSQATDCVYFQGGTTGTWRNTYCANLYPSICKTRASDGLTVPTIPPLNITCPQGWKLHNGHCYFVSKDPVNYFHAQLDCHDRGASVVSVHSAREQVYLNALLGCGTRFWIGLERANPCVKGAASNCFEWLDRSSLNYMRWASGHPSSTVTRECVYSMGEWHSDDCTNKRAYVCKMQAKRN